MIKLSAVVLKIRLTHEYLSKALQGTGHVKMAITKERRPDGTGLL